MQGLVPIGSWQAGTTPPAFTREPLLAAIRHFREPVHLVRDELGRLGVAVGGQPVAAEKVNGHPVLPLIATLPAMYPEWLGDRGFLEVHRLRFPYVTGSMANGIATPRIVIAMARAGMLGFFGAAGLSHAAIARGLDEIDASLAGTGLSWGSNLIHSPNEPQMEAGTVELFLKRGVVRAEASAFMGLTAPLVRYAATGLRRGPDGRIHRRNHVFAKVSRPEVARRFLVPPPAEILDGLVAAGQLTREEAELARRLPLAEDLTAESDSGGHTDNRPLGALFPALVELRDQVVKELGYDRPIRIGAAGGLGTPGSVAAAFQLGAAYVMTGSVNQACVESGLSEPGRKLLCQAGLADVVMAPAADMFELGVNVQVLQRGTMFGSRAKKLYEVYTSHAGLADLAPELEARLEKEIFQGPIEHVVAETEKFWSQRDPHEVERARKDPKHQMALVFRWYLGLSSRWAIAGDAGRKMDYQIWCGPAQGAFNAWVKGTFLEPAENRTVVQVARNLLEGAATLTRAQQLRSFGVAVPAEAFRFVPRPLEA